MGFVLSMEEMVSARDGPTTLTSFDRKRAIFTLSAQRYYKRISGFTAYTHILGHLKGLVRSISPAFCLNSPTKKPNNKLINNTAFKVALKHFVFLATCTRSLVIMYMTERVKP